MAEYGRKLVEAAARAGATKFWQRTYRDADGMVATVAGRTWQVNEDLYRAALLAFLDALIEAEPTLTMERTFFAAYEGAPEGTGKSLAFGDGFTAMCRALRTEIEAAHE